MSRPASSRRLAVSRRDLLSGTVGAALGAGATGLVLAGGDGSSSGAGGADGPARDLPSLETARPVPAAGEMQAGVVRPDTPQAHGLLYVYDLDDPTEPTFLPALGERILDLTDRAQQNPDLARVLPDGPGDLTITVGVGPAVMRARVPAGPGTHDLPAFAGDDRIDPARQGGDLLVAAYATDAGALAAVQHELSRAIPRARLRWAQRLFRSPGSGTITRNPLGFHDGIVVPRTDRELAENVYLPDPAGATICVVRRLRLDLDRFRSASLDHQEAVIGRRLTDGAPLSGGELTSEIDLHAKSPAGDYLVPARAHARAAHPSFTGSKLMLRRGYAFDDGPDDAGLMFICFQQDLHTFVQTQHRLDEVDDLMGYVTPTGSGTFLILPGFDADRPLGAPSA